MFILENAYRKTGTPAGRTSKNDAVRPQVLHEDAIDERRSHGGCRMADSGRGRGALHLSIIAQCIRRGWRGGGRPGGRRSLVGVRGWRRRIGPAGGLLLSFSSRARQLSAVEPSRSRIPVSSAEITALPSRKRRPV